MSGSHLHISVTFLQPTCHARLGKEEAAPNEWPPSPLRLFQAMVAGSSTRRTGMPFSRRNSSGVSVVSRTIWVTIFSLSSLALSWRRKCVAYL